MNTVVVGFGAIGCRHAQSLMMGEGFKDIYVVEPSDQMFAEGIKKIGAKPERFLRVPDFSDLNCSKIKVAIIATSSEPRFQIMKQLIELGVKYFLVEKIVFQSMTQFNSIIELMEGNGVKAYCNFVNRYFNNYVELEKKIKVSASKVSMNVIAGNLGLGCNAIHYMDLFEYLTGNPISMCKSALTPWTDNCRRGSIYREFSGILFASDDRNNTLSIYFDPSHVGNVNIELSIDDKHLMLSEGSQIEYYFDGQKIGKREFDIIPTSKLTSKILNDILSNSTLLPTIASTRSTHSFLFKQINQTLGLPDEENILCPIT
ncbi:MAG: Gfo/Idh/MocA family oxidoreductase [Smithellaceae bacterium]